MKNWGFIQILRHRWLKPLTVFVVINILTEMFWPIRVYALSGGPSQPEVESFEPVGTTDMVDIFSGDFNYNIPLFDVGGYPINLSYHAGIGMDQEASWVGLGWNINPGVINRSMRGLPDDFNGDVIQREVNLKPNRTIGLNVNLDFELFGFPVKGTKTVTPEATSSKAVGGKLGLSFGFGIIYNNYKGIGYSFDLKTSISRTTKNTPSVESPDNYTQKSVGLNIGLSANSQTGSNWNFSADQNFTKSASEGKMTQSGTMGIGLGYNSFAGISDFSVSYSEKNKNKRPDTKSRGQLSAYVPIGTTTYTPSQGLGFSTSSLQLNAALGFSGLGAFPDVRASGFYNSEVLITKTFNNRAYGYLYESVSESKRGQSEMVLDFNREKDGAYNRYMTNLPLTNPTYDIYSVQGQGTGGMYRPFHTSLGVYYDPKVESIPGIGLDRGIELGFGNDAHFGATISNKGHYSISGIWDKGNKDFLNEFNRPSMEQGRAGNVYFKAGGELTESDSALKASWNGDVPYALKLKKLEPLKRFGQKFAQIDNGAGYRGRTAINDAKRPIRANIINFLTATEANLPGIGLDPALVSYSPNFWEVNENQRFYNLQDISRTSDQGRRGHHIGEITSTSSDGTRYVYGIPVYNSMQVDASFAISPDLVGGDESSRYMEPERGLVTYTPEVDNDKDNNERGANHYFEKTTTPGYAHSFLLSGVLSPDYVDVTGDGITDDDLGSAVKFNYRRTSSNYRWRNPISQNKAMLDQGYLSDPSDDKASYSYGEKEIWYLHSIVSRTHIAEFRISPRTDGRGVISQNGGLSTDANNRSYKLDSIIVYSKWDKLKNGSNATPVKVIVFSYDYSLCPGVLNNSTPNAGKLTLKAVYFTYGKSNKGALSPYRFTYSSSNPAYDQTKYDRWGNYKDPGVGVKNQFFPYVDQYRDSAMQAQYASSWNLSQVDLPSGGKINVEYEADDYAYVQDKRAMQMLNIIGSTFQVPSACPSSN